VITLLLDIGELASQLLTSHVRSTFLLTAFLKDVVAVVAVVAAVAAELLWLPFFVL